jgi:putative Holliday junction resolvase
VKMRGRRIAFDYGDVRTGVAICDPDGILATPLEAISTQDLGYFQKITSLLAEYEPVKIFVGMPLHMSGLTSESSSKVEAFVVKLESLTKTPVALIDERLSTVSAQRRLKEAG